MAGGYNRTLNSSGNPLSGRQAWSGTGTSGTNGLFITTTVNLPVSAGGHAIVLRWRSGFDDNTSPAGAGWRIDNVLLALTRPVCSVTCSAPSDLIFKDGLQTP